MNGEQLPSSTGFTETKKKKKKTTRYETVEGRRHYRTKFYVCEEIKMSVIYACSEKKKNNKKNPPTVQSKKLATRAKKNTTSTLKLSL